MIFSISPKNIFVGIHVGRHRLEFVALGLTGNVLASLTKNIGFLQKQALKASSQQELDNFLSAEPLQSRHIVGIGISTPYFWEGWQSILPPTSKADQTWNSDIVISLFTFADDVEVTVENDGSSAALGELTFGTGASYKDFIYVNIGTLIGGGLVIDGTIRTGARGNTGAIGPFPVSHSTLSSSQDSARPFEHLLSRASLYALHKHAKHRGLEIELSTMDALWCEESIQVLNEWIEDCSAALAQFFIGAWSLIELEAIILDGALPRPVLNRIIDATQAHIQLYQTEGVITCDVKLGKLGSTARSIGAACLPVYRVLGPPPIKRLDE
jgi:predicted NBD/HSP70 family sugar kinase